MFFRALGFTSLAIVIVSVAPYWLRAINNWTFKTKDKRFFDFLKLLRKFHKPLGLALAVIAVIHGYLALGGNIRLHTGLLAYIGFFLSAFLGGVHHKTKNRTAFKVHRIVAGISVLLVVIHLLWPWALYTLFGI